jgi:GR25 family glycosyltransferase involved in LPS biosynthesis
MDNIETYCISLEKKREEWDDITANIRKNTGLNDVKIFPAIYGKEVGDVYENPQNISKVSKRVQDILKENGDIMSVWALYKLKKAQERREHAQLGTWGAVGCYLSHYLLWKMTYERDLSYTLIFEDDVTFSSDFEERFRKIVKNIPEDTDVIFLDSSWCEISEPTKYENLDRVKGQFFGTHAYIITSSGAKKLLEKIFPIEIQIDAYMSFVNFLKNGNMNVYRAYGMCGQSMHQSSIQTICMTCDITPKRLLYWNVFWCLTFLSIISYLVYRLMMNKK